MLGLMVKMAVAVVVALTAAFWLAGGSAQRGSAQASMAAGTATPARPAASSGPNLCKRGEPLRLAADARGHFHTQVEINGRYLRMMVDTGASAVAISADEAQRLGIRTDTSARRTTVSTANGIIPATSVLVDNFRMGPICLDRVEVLVVGGNGLGGALLGMSVLRRLERFEMSQRQLVMAR